MNSILQNSEKFPVESKTFADNINSVKTNIIVQDFSNRLLIFISQLDGRPGTLVEVTQDKPAFDHFDPQSNTYDIKALFGADKEEVHLAARIFAAAISGVTKPILLSIALKNFEKDNLFSIRDTLVKLTSTQ